MTADQLGALVTILGSMVLVGSALMARRARLRWQMALAWAAIVAALVIGGLWLDGHR